MISISINGCPAAIKKGSSFEFIRENNLFDSSEGYTFDMEFPLKDSPENQAAFGFIHNPSVDKPTGLIPCVIQSGSLVIKGSVAVMNVTESSVKVQFLEGVDVEESQNLLDNTFINELDLGKYPKTDPKANNPSLDMLDTGSEVCYPWMQKDSVTGNNLFKIVTNQGSRSMVWDEKTEYLTWQPYLKVIVRRIADNIGYELDKSVTDIFLDEDWSRAVICNCLPQSWKMPDYKDALPAWTVSEFFDKLGKLMKAKFSFDHVEKKIFVSLFENSIRNAGYFVVEKTVRNYDCSVSRNENDADFFPLKGYRYKDYELDVWKYLCCPDFLKSYLKINQNQIISFDSWEDAAPDILYYTNYQKYNNGRGTFAKKIIYIKNIDTYFVMRANFTPAATLGLNIAGEPFAMFAQMTPLNIYGPPVDSYDESVSYEDLDFIPAVWDWSDLGQMMILPAITLDDDSGTMPEGGYDYDGSGQFAGASGYSVWIYKDPWCNQSFINQKIEADKKNNGAFYDSVFLGFHVPWIIDFIPFDNCVAPFSDMYITMGRILNYKNGHGKMRLKNDEFIPVIDPKVMYEFSFLSKEIPDINATFLIHGKKFVCRKLTVKFSDSGVSEVLKGQFYRIVD